MNDDENIEESNNISFFLQKGKTNNEGNQVWRTSTVFTPVVGQNLAVRSQEAGKAAYSREYGFVHASPMSKDGGWGAPCMYTF